MTTLAEELAKPDYAALSDSAAAAAINAKTTPVTTGVSGAWLLTYLGAAGLAASIYDMANNTAIGPAHPQWPIRNACVACVLYLQGGAAQLFDCADARNLAMMDALIAAGLMTEQNKAAVIAQATSAQPWYVSAGLRAPVTAGLVAVERGTSPWSATLESTSFSGGNVVANVRFAHATIPARSHVQAIPAQDWTTARLAEFCTQICAQLHDRDLAADSLTPGPVVQ